MRYVALLRGVNVGGNGKVDMKQLPAVFEAAGMSRAKTYINSGNVVFETDLDDRTAVTELLENSIERHFGIAIRVLVKSRDEIASIVAALPDDWTNDDAAKCDVFFLWPAVDRPSIVDELPSDPAIDDVRYTPGAVLRWVARKNAAKSKLTRIAGTPLYQEMTIRNCNTARKLRSLLEE